eukprot:COSAG01_NODE_17987_length_1108_cov_1.213082_1_plen_123_part_10
MRPKRLVSGPTFLQGFLRMHDVDGGASIYVMPLRDLCSLSTRVALLPLRCRCTFAFNPDKPKRLHVHDQGSKGIPRNCVAELIASFTDEGDKADDSIYFGVFRFYINRQPAFAALCYTGAGLH